MKFYTSKYLSPAKQLQVFDQGADNGKLQQIIADTGLHMYTMCAVSTLYVLVATFW